MLCDIEVTEEKIKRAIQEIPNNTSAGPDTWPAELIKNCQDQLNSMYPRFSSWKKTDIIYTVNFRFCTLNYRSNRIAWNG